MSAWLDQPQSKFLVAAVVTLTAAAVAIKWAGSLLRGQLGTRRSRSTANIGAGDCRAEMTASVPPALVREALAKGLVTPGQLAGMSAIERQFVFASLRGKLGDGETALKTGRKP
jgi:hypothetical protein